MYFPNRLRIIDQISGLKPFTPFLGFKDSNFDLYYQIDLCIWVLNQSIGNFSSQVIECYEIGWSLQNQLHIFLKTSLLQIWQLDGVYLKVMVKVVLQLLGHLRLLIIDFSLQHLYVLFISKRNLLLLRIVHLLDAGQKLVLRLDGLRLEYFQEPVANYAAHLVLDVSQHDWVLLPGGFYLGVEVVDTFQQVGENGHWLLVFDFVINDADVVEASREDQVHEFNNMSLV